jgi:ribosomal RNA-processing protein 36
MQPANVRCGCLLQVKEKAAVKEGKKPYFLKKSAVRKAELVEKYKELKASGQLAKFLEKRRKRNASKDHKLLPSSRR